MSPPCYRARWILCRTCRWQDIARLEQTDAIKVEFGPRKTANHSFFALMTWAPPFPEEKPAKKAAQRLDDNPPCANPPWVRESDAIWLLTCDAIRQVVDARPVAAHGRYHAAPPPIRVKWLGQKNWTPYSAPDVERAVELMAEAGYADGFSVDLHTPNDRYLNDEAISQALVGMLSRIGIKVNLVSQTRSMHFPRNPEPHNGFLPAGLGCADL